MIKKVGTAFYAHRSNIEELSMYLTAPQYERLQEVLELNYRRFLEGYDNSDYVIIKYDTQTHNVSLIECPDWDTSNEPTVGDSFCYKTNGDVVITHGGNKVYHSKWQFVSADYDGFNIQDAKDRTLEWSNIEKLDKSRIGNKAYWHQLLTDNNIKI